MSGQGVSPESWGMPMIEVQDLHKAYGERKAVDGVTFAVEEGEIFGILGPVGAGKTTTVECVAGLRTPDRGTVRVAGLDPVARHAEVTRLLGVQLQQSELQAKLTVREALALYASFYERPADWRALAERLGLADRLGVRCAKLSGGQRQRLFIALALVGDPRAVILDELTTGLDPRGRRDTWALVEDIRRGGVTVLLVTHFMEEAQRLCDRVAVIDRGRVTALDTPGGLIRRAGAARTVSFAADTRWTAPTCSPCRAPYASRPWPGGPSSPATTPPSTPSSRCSPATGPPPAACACPTPPSTTPTST